MLMSTADRLSSIMNYKADGLFAEDFLNYSPFKGANAWLVWKKLGFLGNSTTHLA
jgi:hypothetical protein